jgi:hypothetical protein
MLLRMLSRGSQVLGMWLAMLMCLRTMCWTTRGQAG